MKIKNEQGYALVMVLFAVLLLTVLGTMVLSASIGGAVRTETRENDVQSLHLAEKSLNEAAAYLVSTYHGKKDIDPNDLDLLLGSIVGKLKTMKVSTELNADHIASGRITDAEYTQMGKASYIVTISANAEVNGVERQLQQEIIFDAYPEFLRYAYGSEGNVIINGSPYAIGNIYAGGALKIDKFARYFYHNDDEKKKPSNYPVLDNGSVYVPSIDSIQFLNVIGNYESIRNQESEIEEKLGITANDIMIRPKEKFISVNIEGTFIEKLTEAANLPLNSQLIRNNFGSESAGYTFTKANMKTALEAVSIRGADLITPQAEPTVPVLSEGMTDEQYEQLLLHYRDPYNQYLRTFTSPLQVTTIFDGDLTLDGLEYKGIQYSDNAREGKWFIVNGDLHINNLNQVNPLKLYGNILVVGNVTINGHVEVDASMIVLGVNTALQNTVIQDATLKGRNVNGHNKQLVLMTSDRILVNRVAAFENPGEYDVTKTANILDAFFYTDSEAELYGVGSTFWLNGGFFAKKQLTINAVRGNAKPNTANTDIEVTGRQEKTDARFVIQYNSNIFDDQYSGLPRVKQISVRIGKKKLVQ